MATPNDNATSILKEYLVSIGYTVNKQSQKDAKESVDGMGKSVEDLNEKLDNPRKASLTANLDKVERILARTATRGFSIFTKTAVAAGAAAVEFGYRMDSLYHAAQRSNTSVGYLYTLGKAFSQIGLSAEDARKRTEAFHSFMISRPQMPVVLKSLLGVDANSETAYIDTIKALGKIPDEFQRNAFAQMFNIDPADLNYLLKNMKDFEEAFKDIQDSAKRMGTNMDEIVKSGEKFNKVWRHALDTAEQLSFVIRNKLVKDYEGFFASVRRGMENLGFYINKDGVFVGTAKYVGKVGTETYNDTAKPLVDELAAVIKGSFSSLTSEGRQKRIDANANVIHGDIVLSTDAVGGVVLPGGLSLPPTGAGAGRGSHGGRGFDQSSTATSAGRGGKGVGKRASTTHSNLGRYQEELEHLMSWMQRSTVGGLSTFTNDPTKQKKIRATAERMGFNLDAQVGDQKLDDISALAKMVTDVVLPNNGVTLNEYRNAYNSGWDKREEAQRYVLNQTNVYNITGSNSTEIAGKVSRQAQQDTANGTRYMGQGTR